MLQMVIIDISGKVVLLCYRFIIIFESMFMLNCSVFIKVVVVLVWWFWCFNVMVVVLGFVKLQVVRKLKKLNSNSGRFFNLVRMVSIIVSDRLVGIYSILFSMCLVECLIIRCVLICEVVISLMVLDVNMKLKYCGLILCSLIIMNGLFVMQVNMFVCISFLYSMKDMNW